MSTLRRTVFLIGYMCCGKTTLGQAVGHMAGIPFVDLDEYIERQAGTTVAGIFASEGETGFRRRESAALAELAGQDALIACGGGTPCQPGNIETMRGRGGIVVWLDATEERIVGRLTIYGATRPLVADKSETELKAFVSENLAARRRHYGCADVVFDSSRLETAEEIAATAEKFINEILKPYLIF